jgi:hydrogenase/urease accessory protein HupE
MMRKKLWLAWLTIIGLLVALEASGHEIRPAYLEITQPSAHEYDIVWKQPVMGDLAVHLVPHLSNGWLEQAPAQQYAAGGFLIRSWRIQAREENALEGTSVEIEGLNYTITDVFARIRLANGRHLDAVIHPEAPRLAISPERQQQFTLPAYLRLGIEHILTGPDHLLFVLGLLLIVRSRVMLLKTISAFTVAHSITLATVILGKVILPTSFVETLISLSIVFIAPEVVRAQRGETSLTLRFPWAVAFIFGLFHGMGFAGGLTSLGFKSHELFSALVLFNLGVEIGQLTFVGVALSIGRVLGRWRLASWPLASQFPAYLVGVAGAYWTIQNGTRWLGIHS